MKKVFLYGALLGTLVSVAGASTTALAADYSMEGNGATAKSIAKAKGKVKFVNSKDGNIPDPVDPVTPIDPIDPVNPSEIPLRIQHVSNFNFNQRRMPGTLDLIFNAESVPVKSEYKDTTGVKNYKGRDGSGKDQNGATIDPIYGDLNDTKVRETAPFVSTLDIRTTRGKGWNLKAQASPFTLDGKADGAELKGASVAIANAFYASEDPANPSTTNPVVAPTAASKVPYLKLAKGDDLKEYNDILKKLKIL